MSEIMLQLRQCMKNKCIICFIKRVECNYFEETHEKIEKDKQINKRCTSNSLHAVAAARAVWELRFSGTASRRSAPGAGVRFA